jgi:hypothetical protein
MQRPTVLPTAAAASITTEVVLAPLLRVDLKENGSTVQQIAVYAETNNGGGCKDKESPSRRITMVTWECEIRSERALMKRIKAFLGANAASRREA